jgi:hypothetical protein
LPTVSQFPRENTDFLAEILDLRQQRRFPPENAEKPQKAPSPSIPN